jgi:F-type H+-transporting ATPase subunit gamma
VAKARAIVKRRKAVQNIRKITQTMQLIATARFQKCLRRATASKPYTERITEMIQTLSGLESVEHPLFKPHEVTDRSILLVITSNRGLCGAYNAAALRLATEQRKRLAEKGITPSLEVVGKKGISYMRFLRLSLSETVKDVEDRIAYVRVAEMAERYMAAYEAGEVDRVEVLYTRYHSVGVQRPTVAQLLPIASLVEEDGGPRRRRPEFEFSPPPEILLARLVPETVKIRLYQYFNEAILSEQVARMVAMKAATDAAGDMIKYLSTQYNRARQTQITLELADIVGGSEALK